MYDHTFFRDTLSTGETRGNSLAHITGRLDRRLGSLARALNNPLSPPLLPPVLSATIRGPTMTASATRGGGRQTTAME